MSDVGQRLFQMQKDAILAMVDRRLPRTGVIATSDVNGITVVDPLTGDTESEVLVPLGFSQRTIGERVVILPLADGSRVVLPLGQAKYLTRQSGLTIDYVSQNAFRVQNNGVNRVVVDSTTPQLELWNATDLVLLSDNGATTVGRWDAATGTIQTGNIISDAVRGMQVIGGLVDGTPTTSTNASITTYVEAGSWSVTLPAGSAWSVWAMAVGNFKNNTANDGARMYVDINGDVGTSQGITSPTANAVFSVLAANSKTALTGSITLKTFYRAETGGTATALDQLFWAMATRTAV